MHAGNRCNQAQPEAGARRVSSALKPNEAVKHALTVNLGDTGPGIPNRKLRHVIPRILPG